jgi:uncharacterized membrane protein YoaK (UPF0700 family)
MRRSWAATVALIVLSFGSGATDAFAFLLLGGIFSANMTGNLVLAGLIGRPDYLATLIGAAAAIVAFALATYVGFALTRPAGPTGIPRRTLILAASGAVAQTSVLVVWLAAGGHVDETGAALLVAVSSAAMGLQTVVGRRSASVVTTTFQTGTIVGIMQDLAEHRRGDRGIRIVSILALVAGALCGALAIGTSVLIAPALPALAAVTGTALLVIDRARRPREAQASVT